MKMTAYRKLIALVAALISVCSPAVATDKHAVHSDTLHHPGGHATIPSHKQAYSLRSGAYDGRIGADLEPTSVLRSVVEVPNVPWLKLYFDNCELGSGSYLKITSREDGAYQYLNSTSLKQWYNTSAFFNGDAVEIELFVAPEDKQIHFEITEVLVGGGTSNLAYEHESSHAKALQCAWPGICGDDDRVSSNDPAIGRLIRVNASGTSLVSSAFITSNGTHICSGHTFPVPGGDTIILEFDVPASDPDGTPNFADPNDQYTMDLASVESEYDPFAAGRDWAVFRCNANSNTGFLPVQAQNAFYRLSLDSTPATIRLTGFGLDECPPGTGANQRNSSSSTQQTHADSNDNPPSYGDIGSGNHVYWRYNVDIRVGSCGSPVIPEGTDLAVGIQNLAPCPDIGTSFDCDPLENAVNIFPGANIIYADNGHPFATGAGTVFRPFSTVAGAAAAVPVGGIVSIVQGSYNESMTINTAMTIVAPVGNVTIGPGPSPAPKVAEGDSDPAKRDRDNLAVPSEYNLSQNYPNPFNPQTTIEYALPNPGFVKLQIFDMLGQEVRTLINEFQQPGFKSAIWDGKNNQGQLVPSGIYLYKIITDGFTQSSKSILLR